MDKFKALEMLQNVADNLGNDRLTDELECILAKQVLTVMDWILLSVNERK
jgi:hypothetical protein